MLDDEGGLLGMKDETENIFNQFQDLYN